MGHFLSKNGYGLTKKSQKLRKKKKKRRNCFLQGPCMLCFIVHGSSGSVEDDWRAPFESAAVSKLASLNAPEECVRFLLSPRELAVWEGQGRSLLSKLIGPPALFCAVVPDYSEMVCKRKCAELQRCTPRKQPRCAFQEAMENGEERGDGRCLLHSSSSSSSASPEEEDGSGVGTDAGSASTSSSSSYSCCCQTSQNESSEETKSAENTDTSHINQLPSSILLKVCFTYLT